MPPAIARTGAPWSRPPRCPGARSARWRRAPGRLGPHRRPARRIEALERRPCALRQVGDRRLEQVARAPAKRLAENAVSIRSTRSSKATAGPPRSRWRSRTCTCTGTAPLRSAAWRAASVWDGALVVDRPVATMSRARSWPRLELERLGRRSTARMAVSATMRMPAATTRRARVAARETGRGRLSRGQHGPLSGRALSVRRRHGSRGLHGRGSAPRAR